MPPERTIDALLIALEDALDFCADEPLALDREALAAIWRELLEASA
jgi:hypothetical protein